MTEPTHTFTEIREASNAFLANAGTKAFQDILDQFNVSSIQELKPEKYDRFLRILELPGPNAEPELNVNIPEFQLKKQEAERKKERRLYIMMTVFMIIVAALILAFIIMLGMAVFKQ